MSSPSMRDRYNACIEAFQEGMGERRIVASSLAKCFTINDIWAVFEGAFLGKAFLTGSEDRRLWTYFRKSRSSREIVRYLSRIKASAQHRITLLRNIQTFLDDQLLVDEGVTSDELLYRSARHFLTSQYLMCLYILPTFECNFRCPHCYVTRHQDKSALKPISVEKMRRGIDVFYDNLQPGVVPMVRILGGEPLMRYGLLKEIVTYIRQREQERLILGIQQKRSLIQVTTNAALIDREVADWLYANDIRVGVSLDGRKKAHDRMRMFKSGTGTFDAVIKGIDNLKRVKIPFSIFMTIGRHNLESIERDVKWIFKNLSQSISIDIMEEFLVGRNPSMVSRQKLPYLMQTLENIYDFFARKGAREKRFGKLWDAFIGGDPRLWVCTAHGGEVALMPDGSIVPCHRLDFGKKDRVHPYRGMNIHNTRTWRNWSRRNAYSIRTLQEDCPYRLLCAGGCAALALKRGGGFQCCENNICELMDFHVRYMLERCIRDKLLVPY